MSSRAFAFIPKIEQCEWQLPQTSVPRTVEISSLMRDAGEFRWNWLASSSTNCVLFASNCTCKTAHFYNKTRLSQFLGKKRAAKVESTTQIIRAWQEIFELTLKGLISRRKLLICVIRHWEISIATNKIKIGQFVVFLMIFDRGTPGGH